MLKLQVFMYIDLFIYVYMYVYREASIYDLNISIFKPMSDAQAAGIYIYLFICL
jgi:hypothetical protein